MGKRRGAAWSRGGSEVAGQRGRKVAVTSRGTSEVAEEAALVGEWHGRRRGDCAMSSWGLGLKARSASRRQRLDAWAAMLGSGESYCEDGESVGFLVCYMVRNYRWWIRRRRRLESD
ncbi:unnamed protein product [Linum trigynum]|uniref:Uncharacterized protein n=1 Tax=Linum trigynum TaxID=586398 RepID=A0AAV2CE10_9ROSI